MAKPYCPACGRDIEQLKRSTRTGEFLDPKWCPKCHAVFVGYDEETGRISIVQPEPLVLKDMPKRFHKCCDCGAIFSMFRMDCPRCKGYYNSTDGKPHRNIAKIGIDELGEDEHFYDISTQEFMEKRPKYYNAVGRPIKEEDMSDD